MIRLTGELQLHFQIAKVLREHCTWQFTHMAHGEKRDLKTAIKLKQMGLKPGWPDFILLSPLGHVHFLELKRPGGRLSQDQKNFRDWCWNHFVEHRTAWTQSQALDVLMEWDCLDVSQNGLDHGKED